MLNRVIKFFLENRLVTYLLLFLVISLGIATAPFSWKSQWFPRDPVPVDAIPDIGENQQIVYTEWAGKSPQDIEDQISYPLTTALLGVPGVKTIRSNSIFGLSSIYIIFDEDVEFYWSRTRILEKLNSLSPGTLPDEVTPALGPDATALGQIYWYTLEGRDKDGKPNGGWEPYELRTIQDFYVKYGLSSASGVAEVASIGGFVKEYQVDIDPAAMKEYGVNVSMIMKAVKESNLDIGARTIEFNRVEYLVRGIGYIKNLEDLEKAVVVEHDNTPIRIQDVARVSFGPANRRGGLDKSGAEAVGGVVVARYGANPMEVINHLKAKIAEIEPGLPSKTLDDGSVSKVTIVPFYDRTGLIKETLGTLESALTEEILISIIVVLILVLNLRASFLISSLLPLGVLMTFVLMRQFGVDANIVALSGIAIAIGVMVDVGVVITENIIRHLDLPENKGAKGSRLLNVIYEGTTEVASAVITALLTTVISFLPVFAMQAAEGKLFKPLAFTKTFAMLAALVIGIVFIPTFARLAFSIRFDKKRINRFWNGTLVGLGLVIWIGLGSWLGIPIILFGLNSLLQPYWPDQRQHFVNYINILITVLVVLYFLAEGWMPLGVQTTFLGNFLFVAVITGTVLGLLMLVVRYFRPLLNLALEHKKTFLILPVFFVLLGITIWQGFDKVFGFVANGSERIGWNLRETKPWLTLSEEFPGVGKEFMPALDEGSFLLMPTTMPHSGIEENVEVIRTLDLMLNTIPEVDMVVGKWGRVNSALDPAPISMFENIINYKSEYVLDEDGHRLRFKVDEEGNYVLKGGGVYNPEEDNLSDVDTDSLMLDKNGRYFRQWREEITSPDDIWDEIVAHSKFPGLTSAPKLQPIQTRLVMLQTGMRAPMGIKVFGPDLPTIEKVGLELEQFLRDVEGVKAPSVFADRVVGKPYLEINIDRDAIARYGLTVMDVQQLISVAIGGKNLTTTVEGRERFPVRVRYAREYRDSPEDLMQVLVPIKQGVQVPLGELTEINYTRGPQAIKSENTFLVSYVIFDKEDGYAEVDVVENAQAFLKERIESGEFELPPGVNYKFTGNYENQQRATKRLLLVIPISLIAIFLLLYFQFKSVATSSMIFTGVFVAFAGGFIMIWLYGQSWFLDFSIAGTNMRDLFQMQGINLSVAVWVGFIALFGIASDNGVIVGTYLKQIFDREKPNTIPAIREAVLDAGMKRIRPAIMTTATTIIALLPVLTSTGKGSDIMVPMAIPSFGGMLLQVLAIFMVPVLYSMWQEWKLKRTLKKQKA